MTFSKTLGMARVGQPRSAPEWFGQPAGLTILFLTEMWEKFSYYGMRTLLIYYMVKQLLMSQAKASFIYGSYTAVVYLTPIVGGYIADRWLGRRQAVILGGIIMAAGHFMMAVESLFYVALTTIAIGNGFYLTTLPGQIAGLYGKDDPRRNAAYNVYYVGINVGGLLAPLLCGLVGEYYGWHWGFTLAGAGMLAGLLIYTLGSPYLPDVTEEPKARVSAGYDDRPAKGVLLLLLGVALAVALLRGAYEQTGNTIALWADGRVDRRLGSGIVIPVTWFQAINPLLIFIITPFLVRIWTRQAAKGREPSAAFKMAIGAGGMAVAYLMLVAVTAGADPQVPTAPIWLALFIALLTAAELWVLPVGLGLFARLAPGRVAATTIAAWYLATFAGNLLAGVLGTFWSVFPPAIFFALMAALAGLSAVALLLLDAPIRQATTWSDRH